MISQIDKANTFKKLHVQGNPIILYNIWDAGSAKTIEEAGAKAIATGSWSVAAAHGYADGEKIPLALVLSNLQQIVANTTLPVSLDFESGYGINAAQVAKNVAKIIDMGAVGINIEDRVAHENKFYSIEEQSERIKAIREMSDQKAIPLFINARTDLFFKAAVHEQNDQLVKEVIKRCHAYYEAGADGFFPIGLKNHEHIKHVCVNSPIPVNIVLTKSSLLSKKKLRR